MKTTNIEWAIAKLVEINGLSILNKEKAINILESYKPFDNDLACIFIIKTLINEGMMQELLSNEVNDAYVNIICKYYGFDKNLILEILEAINIGKKIRKQETISVTEHMKFKGIEITGTLYEFKNELIKQGFEFICDINSGAVFKGEFAGCINCEIIVLTSTMTNILWKVVVEFPKHMSWHTLKDDYEHYKTMFSNKYGKPASYEYFMDPYEEGDGNELTALFAEKCTYVSYYKMSEGIIAIEITRNDNVSITYEDGINANIATSEKSNKAYMDI